VPEAVNGLPIPLVTVEEHHEVFWIWRYAVERGWLSSASNELVHVDEHSDMSLPRLRRPLSSAPGLPELLDFVYEELDIGNFIWPAVYQGLFSRVFWLRHVHSQALWRAMLICAKTSEQCEFVTGSRFTDPRYANAPDQQSVQYSHITANDTFPQHESWTLDIDLDYFCCNSFTDIAGERVEITRDAYEKIRADRYHFLLIAPGSKVSIVEKSSRYYLVFNAFPDSTGPEFDSTTTVPRLNALITWLRNADCPPKLITLCRSVRSGYTPRSQSRLIEDNLRTALQQIYATQEFTLSDLLSEISLPAGR
jgi:hypothetical protein